MSQYNVGLRTLLLQGVSEPEFYGDLEYKFRKIIDVVSVVSVCLVCDSSILTTCPSIPAVRFAFLILFYSYVFVVLSCFEWGTKAEPRARVDRPQTSSSPPVISLLAVPGRLFCFGSLVILEVACCDLWLFSLYINIKIGKNSC